MVHVGLPFDPLGPCIGLPLDPLGPCRPTPGPYPWDPYHTAHFILRTYLGQYGLATVQTATVQM